MLICVFVIVSIIFILKKLLFRFVPKKSQEIYNIVFVHRGFHLNNNENTISAYKSVLNKFGIELDVRLLKDNTIVCFHDRYTKRLLGVPGKLSSMTYKEVSKYHVLDTNEIVPTLKKALNVIKGKSPILIETKGKLTKRYKEELLKVLSNYNGKIYFHAKNIVTYFELKKLFGDKVFWILNPFRKRFEFIKGKDYKIIPKIPTFDNILYEIENTNSAKIVIKEIWEVIHKRTSRLQSSHWLFTEPIAHRGIYDSKIPENSIESFKACVNANVNIEADFIWYKDVNFKDILCSFFLMIFKQKKCSVSCFIDKFKKYISNSGSIRCYHSDRASSKLGQPQSSASKIPIEKSITIEEFLKVVDAKVKVIFDIKTFTCKKKFLDEFIRQLKLNDNLEYVVQSFNPLVLKYFEKNYNVPMLGQVGHSLNGLRNKIRNPMLILENIVLFFWDADYILYDIDKYIHIFTRLNQIIGKNIIGYAPKSYKELKPYDNIFINFVCEDFVNEASWGNYLKKRYNRDFN